MTRRYLDPRNLEAFVAIADTGSFTSAAKQLDTNQPAVSTRLAALESQLTTRLIDRGARRSRLTPIGEVFLRQARAILRENENAFLALERFLGAPGGTLHIGASTVPGTYLLPPVLAKLRQELPKTKIHLVVRDTDETIDALHGSEIEIAVIGRSIEDDRLETITIDHDDIALVATPEFLRTHKVDVHDVATLTELLFVLREPGSATRATVLDHLHRHDIDIDDHQVVLEVRGNAAVRQAVLSGLGAAFMSRLAIAEDTRNNKLVELNHLVRPLTRPLVLVTLRGRTLSPGAERLVEMLADSCRHPSPTS